MCSAIRPCLILWHAQVTELALRMVPLAHATLEVVGRGKHVEKHALGMTLRALGMGRVKNPEAMHNHSVTAIRATLDLVVNDNVSTKMDALATVCAV